MSAIEDIHRCIAERGQVPRAEIGRTLGLSSRTVKIAVDELVRRKRIAVTGYQASTGGRRGQILGLKLGQDHKVAIGVVFRSDEIRLVLVNASGSTLAQETLRGVPGVWDELFLSRICDQINAFKDRYVDSQMRLVGVGITSTLAAQSIVLGEGGKGGELSGAISRRLGVPVYRELLVRCVTLAEYFFGSHDKESEMVYLSVMDHVEMGMVTGGRLLCSSEATRSSAMGHFSVDPAGPPCYCGGRGCLESYVNASQIVSQIIAAINEGCGTSLVRIPAEKLDMRDVMQAFCDRDPLATEFVSRAVEHLVPALRAIQLLLSPRLIVLGGYLRHGGQRVVGLIEESFRADVPVQTVAARIRLGESTQERQETGAAALPLMQDVYSRI